MPLIKAIQGEKRKTKRIKKLIMALHELVDMILKGKKG